MKQKQTGITVFFSYAQTDQAVRDQLAIHLSQLKRDELIQEWSDQQILAGSDRAQEINQAIHSAQIILLLISADFLASDTCYHIEMQQALERHQRGEARVIPVIVRPCDWQDSPFAHLQCLPRNTKPLTTWNNRDEAFVTIARELRKVITQQKFSPLVRPCVERDNRGRLLRRVRATWIEGLLDHALHQEARLDLHLQEQPDALENPWRLQVQELNHTPRSLPIGTSIVEVYDEADGELLILGKPGAGKTTLLLELTRTLLKQAEKDERKPIPVLFHLSSWAEKRQPLGTWMVEDLWTKYQVPRKIGQNWIDTHQVLPLLDGLDEVAKEVRISCIEQINSYHRWHLKEYGDSPIVVCCRSKEYLLLSKRSVRVKLKFRRAISILPLTDEQVNIYLKQRGEQIKGLRQALNRDVELYNLVRQPLMLNIFTLAYQGATAVEVPTKTTLEETQYTVFARYVERMLARREQSKRRKPEQMIRQLTFLAQQMQQHNQTIFSVESLQVTWLSSRILYQWCIGLLSGLVFGLMSMPFGTFFCFALWLFFRLHFELVVWLVVSLVFGLVFGLVGGLITGRDSKIHPAEALAWSSEKAFSGLIVGLILGMIIQHLTGWIGNLTTVLANTLSVGLSGRQIPERLSFLPNEGIWRSCKNGLIIGLISGLVFGLVIGQVSGQIAGLLVGCVIGLVFGLFSGLVFGLVLGLGAFVKHFILRFFLSWRGDLPWDLVACLDEATGRLLLRKVGGNYIFVHRLLLEYFASIDEPLPSTSTSSEDKTEKYNADI